MPFRGVVNPDDLAMLKQALEEYCTENDIGRDDPTREHLAFRIVALFTGGVTTVDELKDRLKDSSAFSVKEAGFSYKR